MSNNAPDYENDLVFPPKSADDLNKQRRQSDVLVTAIEKCVKLEQEVKQLREVIRLVRDTAYQATQDCPRCSFIDKSIGRGVEMTDLTEKRKKGKLPRGWYYVLLFSNVEYIAFIDGKRVVDDRLVESDITEVLAPVPTYQEYLESEAHCVVYSDVNKSLNLKISGLQAQNAELIETNDILSCQNKQLRQLLKECKANFIHRKQLLEKLEELEKPTTDILTRINAAIGESEE